MLRTWPGCIIYCTTLNPMPSLLLSLYRSYRPLFVPLLLLPFASFSTFCHCYSLPYFPFLCFPRIAVCCPLLHSLYCCLPPFYLLYFTFPCCDLMPTSLPCHCKLIIVGMVNVDTTACEHHQHSLGFLALPLCL